MRQGLLQVVVCLVLAGGAVAQSECRAAQGDPLTLGAVFPTEFRLIPQNTDAFYGANAMREAVNACGGVNGQPIEWALIPAYNRDEAVAAVDQLAGQVPLIVGSGSNAVYEGLVEATQTHDVPLWEVTHSIETATPLIFSPQPDAARVGRESAQFIETNVLATLAGERLRIALIYEDAPRAEQIAEGFREVLGASILLDIPYQESPTNLRELAVEMRESEVNVVFTISFHWNAADLWSALRRADANIAAWMMTGSQEDSTQACARFGNTDSMTLVGTGGLLQDVFPELLDSAVYEQYVSLYLEERGELPSEAANQSASGIYVLLHEVLPTLSQPVSAASITEALDTVNSSETGNVVTLRQNQEGNFCVLSPTDIATCLKPYQAFPTWRTRAITQEQRGC